MIEWLSDAATVVNALAVVVLVGVTWYYASVTRKILDESKKMRKAAEDQAISAAAQASTARATLEHLREQIDEIEGLGVSIVRAAIDSTVRSIEDWKRRDIRGNFAQAYAFPSSGDLIPENAHVVIEHARRISEECMALLTDAFSDLRSAQGEIESLKAGSDHPERRLGGFSPAEYDPAPFLAKAFSKLQKARQFV